MELSRNIKGYPNYHISPKGQVFSHKTGIWKKWYIHNGRAMIKLSHNGKLKNCNVSRLVALAYIPNPENKPCVCHKDNNPLNNDYKNLYWGTQSDNMKQMVRDGRSTKGRDFYNFRKGENATNVKLSDRQRRRIIRLIHLGVSQVSLASRFSVHRKTIQHLWKKRKLYFPKLEY